MKIAQAFNFPITFKLKLRQSQETKGLINEPFLTMSLINQTCD